MNEMTISTIETPRLILRPPKGRDFDQFAAAQGNAEFKKHTGGAIDRVKAREDFEVWRQFWEINGYGFFSIIEKESNSWIGRAGPTFRASSNFVEIGWSIIPMFQGRGFAKEAALAVMSWASEKFNAIELFFCIGRENFASQKLAKSIGATRNFQCKLPKILEGKSVEVWHKAL